MNGQYVGWVGGDDPLHGFLSRLVRDAFGVTGTRPAFRAFRMPGRNEVYAYEEDGSGARVVCKFYGARFGANLGRGALMARREYERLNTLRRYHLVGSPHHVIRPLGCRRDINAVLAVEYYAGEAFSDAIQRAIHHGDADHLYWRLTALAFFLATLHTRTGNGCRVDFNKDCKYFDRLIVQLRNRDRVSRQDAEQLSMVRERWRRRPGMWADQQVWLHGDATPGNFLFGSGLDVAAIDLERMRRGDRVFDLGRVAGELQHAFMLCVGDRHRAEPFIGHFLWEYSCHFPDRGQTFDSITARVPYYLALNMLRIARNDYLDAHYARRLLRRAGTLLQAA